MMVFMVSILRAILLFITYVTYTFSSLINMSAPYYHPSPSHISPLSSLKIWCFLWPYFRFLSCGGHSYLHTWKWICHLQGWGSNSVRYKPGWGSVRARMFCRLQKVNHLEREIIEQTRSNHLFAPGFLAHPPQPFPSDVNTANITHATRNIGKGHRNNLNNNL